jgi:hypothetical protein
MSSSPTPPTATEFNNFLSIIKDFTTDLTATYPEYAFLWKKWAAADLSVEDQHFLYDYCVKTYPERFFDILYQNGDIFIDKESKANMCFLPNVDFRILFLSSGVSENTKKTIWKYLQLILFSIVGGIKDKSHFGDTMNLFNGVDENVLQEKMAETMEGITEFFKNMSPSSTNKEEEEENPNQDQNQNQQQDPNQGGLPPLPPNMENIFNHLKGLFEGKIGSLAKEMADEISGEFIDLIDEDMKNTKDPQQIIQKLMKNPKKVMDLMKKVSTKLDGKLKSGEISREELMKEAQEIFGKMKDMGGQEQFKEMFETMAKNMGGMGKNMRMDQSKLDRMMKENTLKDKMRQKLAQKKMEQAAAFSLESKGNTNEKVFRFTEGQEGEKQEKTFIHPDILKEMNMLDKKDMEKDKGLDGTNSNSKKKGKGKGKK